VKPTGLERVLGVVGFTLIAVLTVLTVQAWLDYRDRDSGAPIRAPVAPPVYLESARDRDLPTAQQTKTRPAQLAVVARRGDSWLVVRAGSSSGPVRHQTVLEQGQTFRTTARRLWLELGAAQNVDATLNGKPIRNFPSGTTTALVTARGLRTSSAR
jgi:hypothetical protein